MQMQEDLLITGIIKGERKALEQFYDCYAPLLLGVAMRYCNRRDEAEDQLHDSMLKIIRNIKDFKPSFKGAFEAWMKRITINQCLNSLRQRKDFRFSDEIPEISTESDEVMDAELVSDLSSQEIISMMQSLPVGYRTVLNLYVFEEMSHKEIAKELNISENTSKSQLSKARIAMKKKLEQKNKVQEVAG